VREQQKTEAGESGRQNGWWWWGGVGGGVNPGWDSPLRPKRRGGKSKRPGRPHVSVGRGRIDTACSRETLDRLNGHGGVGFFRTKKHPFGGPLMGSPGLRKGPEL